MNGVTVNVYSRTKDGLKALSANFHVNEFACQDSSDTIFVSSELVEVLQKIRSHFGKAVVINSAYRTEQHNKKVGGSPFSQHKYGTAADIVVRDVAPSQVAKYAETLLPKKGGIGLYSGFTHVDVRASRSRWNSTSGREVAVSGF